jgi:hypothetical protein
VYVKSKQITLTQKKQRPGKEAEKVLAKGGSRCLTSTGLMPTSIIAAPGFIQLPLTRLATPTAAMIISACLVISSGLLVCECTMLTVAFAF